MTKILIVDDNSNDRYMLEALLKGYGYDVTSAGNGAQALLLARKDPPDMIISDIMMPAMDGFSLCREWKKDDKLKNIPFIFYTATYTTHKDEEFAKNLGADRFIIKPQETEALVAKLREVIEEPRAGKLLVSKPPLGEEMEFFRQYNEVLFQKLEKKITQLHTEINERKYTEEKLHEVSLYTRSLIEVSLDPLVTISKDGKITDVNTTTELVTGVSREQLIGSDFSDYFTEPEKAREGYMEVFEKGFVKDYPLAIRHVSGSKTDVLYNASLYKDTAGNVAGVFAAARDITERKQAEEELEKHRKHLEEMVNERTSELRDSQAKYRTLYESSSDAIMMLDEKGFFDCNNATLNIFGFSKKEDFTRVHPADVSPPYQPDGTDSLTAANNKIAQAFQKGMNSFEWMHRRQNGEDFPAEVLLTAFQLGEKQVLQATVRDITQRKKVEDELMTEKTFTDATIDSIPGTFYVVDDQGRLIRWNKAVEEITGHSAEMLRNMNALLLIHEDDRMRIANKIKEVFEKGFADDVIRFLTRNGIRNYIITGRRMALGKNIYLVGCGIDVTERKRAMEMLQQSEEKFKSIFDNALDGILLLDIMTKKFLMGNRMIFEMIGYDEDELMNLSLVDLHTEKDLPYVLEQFEKEARKVIGFAKDIPVKRKDGSIFYADIKSGPVNIGGNTYITGIFRDISERKQAMESLKVAKEEAERANMAKTNFLNTMSHELRTPLNAILGFSELLKQETIGELNEKQKRFIDNIITGGNNLHNIIGQILDAVKMDEGMFELRIEKISVPETLDEVIGVIQEKAAKKNVLLEKNLDPELEYIEADKQKIKQIFINLLDNAVKFSKDEGGTVSINAQKEGDMARFSVSDRGIGIREENIEKIFQKFTQLDSGTSRKYGGTGIGLAISKQFVELHGGKIFVESKYGIGSTFTFLIPLKTRNGEI